MRTMKSRLIIGRFLAAWLLVGLLWADAAFAIILDVKQHDQEQTQWCWAGASQAILEYYGINKTQTQIANYGTAGANTWNWLWGSTTNPTRNGIDLILDHFAALATTQHGNTISEIELTAQLDLSRPFVVRWGWDGGGGHFVVARGIEGDNVYLMDPWYGPTINTYNWVVRGGTHTWTHTLTLNSSPVTAPKISIGAPSAKVTKTGPISYVITYTGASAITLGPADIILNKSGTADGTVSVTGTGNKTRVVTITGITGDGTISIGILAGTATDAAGNPAAGVDSSTAFAVDNTRPTASIGPPSVSQTVKGPVSFKITYTGATKVNLTANKVVLIKTGTANGTVTVAKGTTTAPRVFISNITGKGALSIRIKAGTATDRAGNAAAGAGPSSSCNVVR